MHAGECSTLIQIAAAGSFRSFQYSRKLPTFLDSRQVSSCLLNRGIENILKKSCVFHDLVSLQSKLLLDTKNTELKYCVVEKHFMFPKSMKKT